jgi:hypothetical protein
MWEGFGILVALVSGPRRHYHLCPPLHPTATDVTNVRQLLHAFGDATGLKTNLQKSQLFPIGCTTEEVEPLIDIFQAAQGFFHVNTLVCHYTLAQQEELMNKYSLTR